MSKMIKENEFDSEFSNVKYMVEDNIVLLTWKSSAVIMTIEIQQHLL